MDTNLINSDRDPRERFTDRVGAYRQFRPGYPESAVAFIVSRCGLGRGSVVVDIGCGTGISSEAFLRAGLRVVGVEPNAAMRSAAGSLTERYPDFLVVEGSAEDTGLAGASADLVLAAQAYHWFDPAKSHAEFARVLRPPGWVALIWNERTETTAASVDYEAALRRHTVDKSNVDARRRATADNLRHDSSRNVETFFTDNPRRLTADQLVGAASSASYVPAPGSAGHDAMVADIREVFARHATGGVIELPMQTQVFVFRVHGE